MSAPTTARARARAELTSAIKDTARRHLADQGSAGLSLRAVARELGMASSAVYRYFPSRDDLLTGLIVDAYDSIGEAVEQADAAHVASAGEGDVTGRWLAACRAVRAWAQGRPHEYALIHGSPVPGYRAPQDTAGPASRVPLALGAIVSRAAADGVLAAPPAGAPALPEGVAADAEVIRTGFGPFAASSPDAVARTVVAWSALYGLVSFEAFGQYETVLTARDAYFDYATRALAALIGLPA